MPTVDLGKTPLRELNHALHRLKDGTNETDWEVLNPKGSTRWRPASTRRSASRSRAASAIIAPA